MNRRDEILDLANDLIQNHGYKGFSYADISKALGITKASVHHHFPSKEDLGIAYCEKKLEALNGFRTSLQTAQSHKDQFQMYLEIFRGCKDGKMCGINAMQSDTGDMPDPLISAIRKVSELELEILTEILTGGKTSGDFGFAISPYDQAILISTSLKGALLLARVKNDDSFERVCNAIQNSIELNNKKDTLIA